MVFKKIRDILSNEQEASETTDDYVEVDLGGEQKESKIMVKLFVLKEYDEVNGVLNALREGHTIAIIDTKTLRQRDPIELKRAVSKIKKTTDALEGNIVGFRENMVIVTPSFASVEKEPERGMENHVPREKTDSVGQN